jgi:hypothetical protein
MHACNDHQLLLNAGELGHYLEEVTHVRFICTKNKRISTRAILMANLEQKRIASWHKKFCKTYTSWGDLSIKLNEQEQQRRLRKGSAKHWILKAQQNVLWRDQQQMSRKIKKLRNFL